ncbi:four helix bundle protein [Planctomycetota bacterium]
MSRLLVLFAGRQWAVDVEPEDLAGAVEGMAEPTMPEEAREALARRVIEAERPRPVPTIEETYLRLRAWQRCDRFALAVHRAAGDLHGEGACQIAARLLAVARSAHVYVVEGCGRRSRRDCLFFLRRAETLLEEAVHLLDTAGRLRCLSCAATEELLALHLDAIRALDVLIARLEGAAAPFTGSRALA